MLNLYFGNLISIITVAFILGMLAFVYITVKNMGKIDRWGRRILIFVLIGTAVSGLSATRDSYMMANAIFTPDSVQSLVCSIAGGLIFLIGIVSLFVRNQKFRRTGFMLISSFFIIQVLAVEVSRIVLQ